MYLLPNHAITFMVDGNICFLSRVADVLFDSFASGGRVNMNQFFEVPMQSVGRHRQHNTTQQNTTVSSVFKNVTVFFLSIIRNCKE